MGKDGRAYRGAPRTARRASRRDVLHAALGGAAGFALGVPVLTARPVFAQASAGPTAVRELAADLFVVTAGDTNVVALTGAGGALLVDGGSKATGAALRSAAGGAVRTVPARGAGPTGWGWFDRQLRSDWAHKAATAVSGAGGGFAGLPGVLAELPVTTALMLRAIAQIGAEEGEDVWSEEGRRQCLQVFAFGGPSRDDDQAETGYIAVRLALAELVANAAGQPLRALLPGFLLAVAERFGAQVSVKVAGQAVPVIGAAAGGVINVLFTEHFQAKARGHFIVRRLERQHGWEATRALYDRMAREQRA